MTCANTMPPIVIGCDYGLVYAFELHPDDPQLPTVVDFSGWALDADIVEQTKSGPGSVLLSNAMAWSNAATGIAHLLIPHAATTAFVPGRVFVRAVAIRPDGVRIPTSPLVIPVEHAGTTA